MGYRSDVMAVFYCHEAKDYPAMKLFIEENLISNDGWLQSCLTDNDDHIVFQADDVKWYDSYEDVIKFERMANRFKELADAEDNELSWAYEFVRIGEETNDIEEDYSGDVNNVLNVHREIEINF